MAKPLLGLPVEARENERGDFGSVAFQGGYFPPKSSRGL